MPLPRPARSAGAAGVAALLLATLAACSDDSPGDDAGDDRKPPVVTETATAPTDTDTPPSSDAPPQDDLDLGVSETREDSVYPEVGDPLVDALHYRLDLSWTPDEQLLEGRETLTFRATEDAPEFRLDFATGFEITGLTVDGQPTEHRAEGEKDLVVEQAVVADRTYELAFDYAGSPEAWPAPTDRPDFAGGVGWTTTATDETWTLQEPYGAFTWYAANDQPADKALYDFTLTVPEPWTGIANGELTDTTEADGLRTTTWHLAEPAATYLVTVAFGDYQQTELSSPSGVPISLWVRSEDVGDEGEIDYAPEAMAWLEEILGPYPFDTFGILVVDGESGMETQTMVTLGNTSYSTSAAVVVHELAHHWYGDTVTPADWSDVWMNEGMAMYLQGMWEADQAGVPVDEVMDQWAQFEPQERAYAGPPGDYDPELFGNGNIYYGPALMWHELRERIGDDEFFDLVRAWPESQENGTADRAEYLAWIEERTGEELTDFFDAWLLGTTTPDRD